MKVTAIRDHKDLQTLNIKKLFISDMKDIDGGGYEGIPEVLQTQGDDINLIISDIADIKSHVIAHTIWRKDIDECLSHILVIREQVADIHSLFMAHFSSPQDDAKKGEDKRYELVSLPTLSAPHIGEWYTIFAEQAALVPASHMNIVIDFGIPEDIQQRFKGQKNPEYSDNKISGANQEGMRN